MFSWWRGPEPRVDCNAAAGALTVQARSTDLVSTCAGDLKPRPGPALTTAIGTRVLHVVAGQGPSSNSVIPPGYGHGDAPDGHRATAATVHHPPCDQYPRISVGGDLECGSGPPGPPEFAVTVIR